MLHISLLALAFFITAAGARADIVDDIGIDRFRIVYRYDCERTFLTGSGISPGAISCTDGMRLGMLLARYHFYLYQGATGTDSNFQQRGTDQFYGAGNDLLCGLQIHRVRCISANYPVYGLARTPTGIFQVAVSLTSGPEPGGQHSHYGFAANVDAYANCPEGLVKIRPYRASPLSYADEPSNFINATGTLDNSALETDAHAPPLMTIYRFTPGEGACAGGICPQPNGVGSAIAAYEHLTMFPQLCAVPAERLLPRR